MHTKKNTSVINIAEDIIKRIESKSPSDQISDVVNLLRMALTLSEQIKWNRYQEWVEYELAGYKNDDLVKNFAPYRCLTFAS